MTDEKRGAKYARASCKKGLGKARELDWLMQDMVDERKPWGYAGDPGGHSILKSDNENAVKALKDAVGKLLGERVIPQNSPKGHSQSNGSIEEAGKTITGCITKMKDHAQAKSGLKLERTDNIVQWLVRWVARIPSRFLVRTDGAPAFEKRGGRPCNIATETIRDKVWYKGLKTKSELIPKLDTRFNERLWLGHASSKEY